MTIRNRFGLLLFTISLVFLVSCGGDEFTVGWSPTDAGQPAEDVKVEKPQDANHDVFVDADAGKHDADAKAEDAIKPLDAEAGLPEADAKSEDVLVEAADDVQEEPDAADEDAAEEDSSVEAADDVQEEPDAADEDAAEEPDASQPDVAEEPDAPKDALVEVAPDVQEEPDAPLEDVQPDELVLPDVQDAKLDEPVLSTLCQQNMPGANEYFIIGEAGIGGTIRISIFGGVAFPQSDAGMTLSGWCWGDLGQTLVVCPVPVPGIVPGTDIYVRPGVSIGAGDPQTAQLCDTGICNKTYTLCHGPFVLGIVNGSNKMPGTEISDKIIKYHVPSA